MERIGAAKGITVIDDFGHNPDKIAAPLDTLHAFPGRLLILFQPPGYGPLQVMPRELVASLAARLATEDVPVLPAPDYQCGTVTRQGTSAALHAHISPHAATTRPHAHRHPTPTPPR